MTTAPPNSNPSTKPVMIITGAGRGMGAAAAIMAGQRGYAVAVNYAVSKDRAEQVVSTITADGGTAIAVQADMGKDEDVLRLFDTVDKELGIVRVLINNAGTATQYGPFMNFDTAKLRRLYEVNVFGAFLCAREAVRRMSTSNGGSGGVIVNVSSRAAELGGVNEWVDYASTKGAIDTMTVGLGREVANQGIRVAGLRPGLMDNEFNDLHATPGRLDRLRSQIPMGRAGTNEEMAEAMLWLASDAASYMTAATMDLGGGR